MNNIRGILLTAIFSFLTISLATAFEATVVSATGKAEVQQGTEWKQLAAGAKLAKGAVIQTGFKSELVLQLKESVVTVAPLSRLTIEQLAEKETKDETSLHLDTGSLMSNVKKTENRRVGFTVKSPVATASVRGTELAVTVGFGSTNVETLSGSVAVWSATNTARISTDAEDAAPETPATDGNAPSDISNGEAPRGAFTVQAGQTAGFLEVGSPVPPQTKSAAQATNIGAGTRSAAAGETVALAGPIQPIAPNFDPLTATPSTLSKGSVVITLSFPD